MTLFNDNGIDNVKEQGDFPDLLAVIKPGVDGDLMIIESFNHDFMRQCEHGLKEYAKKMGYDFDVVTEDVFTQEIG